ncbi:hypothetical protein [Novosphingobium sp. AP12]|uniref:hypothetical protein n=1 Tax=Novosphingobium sp. AP12 TaxID=1144305 RepID=UPI0002720B15|nr:hypothetical protein [Novosphingobium sp. AP12]EJL23995.1 hypothetical protein PMI02_03916 [Novosphingobium sp. AP12]
MRAGFVVGAVLLAGCSSAPATRVPAPECRIGDFRGGWVSVAGAGEGVIVGSDAVTVIGAHAPSGIAYVAKRDFGLVSRQVLRQEFDQNAALGRLPSPKSPPEETVCALHLIRPHGGAALVADGRRELVYLEETRKDDAPVMMRLRRGTPARAGNGDE